MLTRPEQRVAVFIDTQNMYHSAKHLYGARVNFAGLVELAVTGRRVTRAIAYVAKSKTGEEQAFFEALMQNGIELKIKDVQEFSSGAKKADWDVGMAVDAISISSHVDAVIIASGDGDFVPLVEYLRAHGVRCEGVSFGASTNASLRATVDTFTDLAEHLEEILIRQRPLKRGGKVHIETDGLPTDALPAFDLGEESVHHHEHDAKTHTHTHAPAPRRTTSKGDEGGATPTTPKRNVRISF